jgi:hypothetical protein
MTAHYDHRETQPHEEREADLFNALPEFVENAMMPCPAGPSISMAPTRRSSPAATRLAELAGAAQARIDGAAGRKARCLVAWWMTQNSRVRGCSCRPARSGNRSHRPRSVECGARVLRRRHPLDPSGAQCARLSCDAGRLHSGVRRAGARRAGLPSRHQPHRSAGRGGCGPQARRLCRHAGLSEGHSRQGGSETGADLSSITLALVSGGALFPTPCVKAYGRARRHGHAVLCHGRSRRDRL